MANGFLVRLFWRALDAVDYWLTQAGLLLLEATSEPSQTGSAPQRVPGN